MLLECCCKILVLPSMAGRGGSVASVAATILFCLVLTISVSDLAS
jgi:hypothetical protein